MASRAALRVGLTGGIGSGKSTVAALFAGLGAMVIDADAIAREVVAPGTPGHRAVVEAFGEEALAPDGTLDRPALAKIVFGSEKRLAQLNAIVHPLVAQRVAEAAATAPNDAVMVYDVPLLVENDMMRDFDVVVVVEAPTNLRLARLAQRGLSESDARERMQAQASDDQRRAAADELIPNDGTREQLAERVQQVWQRLVAWPGRS